MWVLWFAATLHANIFKCDWRYSPSRRNILSWHRSPFQCLYFHIWLRSLLAFDKWQQHTVKMAHSTPLSHVEMVSKWKMNAIRMNVLRSLSTITMYTHLRASIPIAIDLSEEPSMTTLKCKQIVFPNINSMTIAQFIIISFLSSPFTARFHFDFVCLAMYYDHVKRQQIFVSFFSVLFAFILCNKKKKKREKSFLVVV